MEPSNCGYFCLKKDWNDWLVVKKVADSLSVNRLMDLSLQFYSQHFSHISRECDFNVVCSLVFNILEKKHYIYYISTLWVVLVFTVHTMWCDKLSYVGASSIVKFISWLISLPLWHLHRSNFPPLHIHTIPATHTLNKDHHQSSGRQ